MNSSITFSSVEQVFAQLHGSWTESPRTSRKRKHYEDEATGSGDEEQCRPETKKQRRDSLLDKPPSSDPSTVCGHPIHPAYSDRYTKSNCPMCLVETSMANLKSNADIAIANGGPDYWKLATKRTPNSEAFYMTMRCSIYSDVEDISYRHRKCVLVNLVAELEPLSEMELAWEENQPPSSRDIQYENVRMRKQYSATSALHEYYDNADGMFIGHVERVSAIYSHKYSHQSCSIVADTDQPNKFPVTPTTSTPNHDDADDSRPKRKRRHESSSSDAADPDHQNENAISTTPRPNDTDNDDAQPQRKRRRINQSFRFESDVYVCTEADVEALQRDAMLEECRGNTTTPLTANNLGKHDLPNPCYDARGKRRPLRHVVPLKTHDGPRRKLKKRGKAGYQPGKWTVQEGWAFVNV